MSDDMLFYVRVPSAKPRMGNERDHARLRTQIASRLHDLNTQTPEVVIQLLVDAFLAFMELDETKPNGKLSLRERLQTFHDQASRLDILDRWLHEPINSAHAAKQFISFKRMIGLIPDSPQGMH